MSKIVVTAAYHELSDLVKDVAAEMSIEITILEAVLEEAVEQVQKLLIKEQPSVLVSRGATAEMLRQNFSLPVVSLDPSEIDIIEAVYKAKEHSLIIGYFSSPNLYNTEFLRKVLNILGITLRYYSYRSISELSAQMEQAHYDGCEAIVGGGHRGLHMAKSYGMEGYLIYSSRSTVFGALERAQEIITLQEQQKEEAEHMRRASLAKGLIARYNFRDIVGSGLKDTIRKAERYSTVDATVLILGESGTGKELFAQSIHNNSLRKDGPFVALNCATLPENLLESELFGYEEGAFTGAKRGGRMGLFELAEGGTFFLDEIDKMSANLQAGLLRVLQAKELRRVGGDRVIPVNVRVIAASNKDLQICVEEGSFRNDLYYRLNVLNLYLPPLRERSQDILPIVENSLKRLKHKLGFAVKVSLEFISLLQAYHWPGNIRELENVIERYAVLVGNGDTLDFLEILSSFPELSKENKQKLPHHDPLNSDIINIKPGTLEDMETQLISILLERSEGNKSLLAEQLGISRTTLWKKLQLQ